MEHLFTFTKFRDARLNIDYSWYMDIKSIDDLMLHIQQSANKFAFYINDYLRSKDYAYALEERFRDVDIKNIGTGEHASCRNQIGPWFDVVTAKMNTGDCPLLHFAKHTDKILQSKINAFQEKGRILVNKNGGFLLWSKDYVELSSLRAKTFPQFNIRDVKISKFEGGKHYYATLNGDQIIMNGENKWNSEQKAMEAAKKYCG